MKKDLSDFSCITISNNRGYQSEILSLIALLTMLFVISLPLSTELAAKFQWAKMQTAGIAYGIPVGLMVLLIAYFNLYDFIQYKRLYKNKHSGDIPVDEIVIINKIQSRWVVTCKKCESKERMKGWFSETFFLWLIVNAIPAFFLGMFVYKIFPGAPFGLPKVSITFVAVIYIVWGGMKICERAVDWMEKQCYLRQICPKCESREWQIIKNNREYPADHNKGPSLTYYIFALLSAIGLSALLLRGAALL